MLRLTGMLTLIVVRILVVAKATVNRNDKSDDSRHDFGSSESYC